jgi:hypothetical protein
MINVTVDSASELLWIQDILSIGTINCCDPHILLELGCDLHQTVHFEKSENFVDDLTGKLSALLNKQLGELTEDNMNWMSNGSCGEKDNKTEGVVV